MLMICGENIQYETPPYTVKRAFFCLMHSESNDGN